MGEKLFAKPYLYFWLSIPILTLYGLVNGEGTINIDFRDTLFIIQNSKLILILAIAFSIIGFWYWLMQKLKRQLILWMTIIHLIVTIDGIIIAFLLEHFFNDYKINSIKAIVVILIFAVQVIFPLNLILSFFKTNK